MAISVEAHAIQALCNEIDSLVKSSGAINTQMMDTHAIFIKAMVDSSNKQRVILAKIDAAQAAIAQLQYKNFVPMTYGS